MDESFEIGDLVRIDRPGAQYSVYEDFAKHHGLTLSKQIVIPGLIGNVVLVGDHLDRPGIKIIAIDLAAGMGTVLMSANGISLIRKGDMRYAILKAVEKMREQ